jgi:hypothetical protein
MMQGPNNDGQLWYTAITPGTRCGFMTKVNYEIMSASPGTVTFNNQIYCFLQGAGNSGSLYYTTYGSGGWAPSIQLAADSNPAITASPAAVTFSGLGYGQLYVFYQGGHWAGNIHYLTYSEGNGWSEEYTVPNAGMSASPSPVVFNNRLYVFTEGWKNASQLWYSAYYCYDTATNNWQWGNSTQITLNIPDPYYYFPDTAPTAVVFDGELYVFYLTAPEEEGQSNRIYYNTSSNGSSWSNAIQLPGIDPVNSVALISYDNGDGNGTQLYCVYVTVGGELYYTSTSDPSNPSSWSAPVQLGNTTPTPSPPGALSGLADMMVAGLQAF